MKKEWAAKRAERHNERFTAMDTDKNGQISKAEFDAAHAARAEKWGDGKRGDRKIMRGHHMGHGEMRGDMFAKLDANSDGKVTKAERSEEHTSELQSLMRISYAVFCLKKTNERHIKQNNHENK